MRDQEAVSITVRDSRDDDLPTIAEIYAHHVTHGFGSFEETPPSTEELRRRRTEICAKGLPYLVASEGSVGPILGYAYASPYRTRSAYRFSIEDSIYVAPGAARRGIGRILLTALIERATALGYRQMVAVIGDSGNLGSIGLHRALGFAQVGKLPSIGFKMGRWIDGILMQRALGQGDSTSPVERQHHIHAQP
ncbi:MAG TPA: GNAT family N-acetyltransferase [Stellaceae bacterium]|nr:GNAT family N-acetyltransferase [Stellaceae bacterium]